MFKKIFEYFNHKGDDVSSGISRARLDDLEMEYSECEGGLEYVHPAHCLDLIDEIRRLQGWGNPIREFKEYPECKPVEFDFSELE